MEQMLNVKNSEEMTLAIDTVTVEDEY